MAHLLGAVVILGTGAGIAFFMVMAHRTKDPRIIAHTAGTVVIADWIFTATAVVAQPISGVLLAQEVGWDLGEGWIVAALVLYVFVGAFWLPVVWMQRRMRDLACLSRDAGDVLPEDYFRLYRWWFIFGFPAFFAVLAIVWLMIAKPDFANCRWHGMTVQCEVR
jgi:uncharacterized membrane protein